MKLSSLGWVCVGVAALAGCAADSGGAQQSDDTDGRGGSATPNGSGGSGGGGGSDGLGSRATTPAPTVALGAHYDSAKTHVTFAVASSRATRIELWIYGAPTGAAALKTYALTFDKNENVWSSKVKVSDLTKAGVGKTIY